MRHISRKKPGFSKQVKDKLDSMKAFGQSRHIAKSDGSAGSKIFSFNTYYSYMQTMVEFTSYLREHDIKVRDINDISQDMGVAYIKYRESNGYSPFTYSKDMAALNKVFNLGLTKKICGVKGRSIKDITRSREVKAMDKEYNESNYKEQIIIAKATGVRRESILKIKPENFKYDNGVLKVEVKEKGGRERSVTVLQKYQKEVEQIVSKGVPGKALFKTYTAKIDNHAFRSEYAVERYKEISELNPELCSGSKTHGYYKNVLEVLTQDLGHNRIRVCVEHYLR